MTVVTTSEVVYGEGISPPPSEEFPWLVVLGIGAVCVGVIAMLVLTKPKKQN